MNRTEMRKLSYDHEYIATCYHEAGHTITGLLNFLRISDVGIEMSPNKHGKIADLGYTHYDCGLDFLTVEDSELVHNLVMNEINISYAGLAAEKLLYKDLCGTDKIPMALKRGSVIDRDGASELIRKYNLAPAGKKRHAFKKKVFSVVQKELAEFWPDVKLVAKALFKKKRLVYSDLKQILTRKSINKNFWKNRFKDISYLVDCPEPPSEKIYKSYIKNG